MRGDDGDDFVFSLAFETCRIAFTERKPDAKQRIIAALSRARRADNRAEAAALAQLLADNRNRHLEHFQIEC